MMRLLIALMLAGCAAAGGDSESAEPAVLHHQVWAHSADLETYARAAAVRIEAASGVVIEINVPGTSQTAVPLFWSEQHDPRFAGYCSGYWSYIDVNADAPVAVLHELMHLIGASHIAPGAGVMSEHLPADGRLTAADLESLCAEAACTRFAPEL